MKRKIISTTWLAILALLFIQNASAQSIVDISGGASSMDNYFTNLSYRRQVSDNFRIGFELQYGSPKYRFVEAKPFEKGYAWSLSVPLSFKLAEQERIRLDGFVRPGFRFQGIIDPDNNGIEDSLLNSRAVLFEAGLLVNVKLTEKLNLSSGVLLPTAFEIAPTSLFEYMGTPNFTGGLSYLASPKTIVFIKGITGPAFGASGDTYKYIWSAQAGVRFALGKNPTTKSLLLEPSF
ncbi:MAG: hypothetical protein ACK5AS_00725 [Bacteroidota bacterium]|jgi:hypothetical protein